MTIPSYHPAVRCWRACLPSSAFLCLPGLVLLPSPSRLGKGKARLTDVVAAAAAATLPYACHLHLPSVLRTCTSADQPERNDQNSSCAANGTIDRLSTERVPSTVPPHPL
ncbi:hypothetical protein CCHR01_14151 [Colletotrichum chrysophilum]|uniref:Uncharacterized protein n=1 Tax=Colletotrichum chrysophilum TaxID=1836956 RepID=A0AAD9A956_9PEZI|nr:hypothetical protein CCHR01_14151 [Colletotrichum chrysophilum]